MDLPSTFAIAERWKADRKQNRRVFRIMLALVVGFVVLIIAAIVFAGCEESNVEILTAMRSCGG